MKLKSILLIVYYFIYFVNVSYSQWESENFGKDNFAAVYFVNNQVGYVISDSSQVNYILKTNDGGESWHKKEISQKPFPYGNALYFTTSDVGYIVRDSTVLKTNDGGATWTATILSGFSEKELKDVNFWDKDTGYVVGKNLYKTIDAGLTWNYVSTINPYQSCSSLYFISSDTGFVDYGYSIARTIDYGKTWKSSYPAYWGSLLSSYFIKNTKVGYVCYQNEFGISELFRTEDCGNSWTTIRVNLEPIFKNLFFLNSNIGFALVSAYYSKDSLLYKLNSIYKTKDAGKNWSADTLSGIPNAMFFTDSVHGWIVGKEGFIARLKYDDTSDTIVSGIKTWRDNDLFIYPNPVQNEFEISSKGSEIMDVKMFGLDGQEIDIVKSINNEKSIKIHFRNRPKIGIYFVQIKTPRGESIQKIIIN